MARDAETNRWTLYVDESGDFSDAGDEVLVAGVLVDELRTAAFELALREHLQHIMPVAPWPLHAWLLHRAEVFAFLLEREQSADGDSARALLAAATQKQPELVEELRARFQQGQEPRASAQLRKVSCLMRKHEPSHWRRLNESVSIRNSRLSTALRSLESSQQERWVMSTESELSDAHQSGDRYLNLLVTLMERVRDAFLTREGAHHINIHLATRHVQDPVLCAMIQLNKSHIEWATRQLAATSAPGAHERVRFGLGGTHTYNADVPAGLVLADLFANRLRHQTRGARRAGMTSATLLDAMHALTGISGEFGAQRLPGICASGVARQQLNSVREARAMGHTRGLDMAVMNPASALATTQAMEWEAHVQ